MKIRLEKKLKFWIDAQVDTAMSHDIDADRNALVISVLTDFARGGDAERYVRPDGKIGWRATELFLDRIGEYEREADEYDA
jgi:hypothetical protein